MSRASRSHSELRVRMLDYDDFPSPAMDIASKYFRDLGALNAVFRKRLNQMLSLHPCVPLADTLQEYISYQTRLEEKYAISLPERLFKTTSIPFEFSAQPPIQPLDPSSLPFASGSEASPFVRPMDPVGFSSNASSSKRKVEEDKGTGKPKKTAAAPLFSFKPGASSSIFASSASDSRNFQTQFDQTGKKNQEFESRLKKPSMNVPISDNPKKPVLEGFSLAKHGEKPFSFQAVFPHLSQNSKEKTVDDSNTDENHAGDTASGLSGEKPVTVRAEATFPLFKSGFGSLPKSPTESREKDNVIQKNENSGSVKKSLFGNVPPGSSVFGGFSFSGFQAAESSDGAIPNFSIPKPPATVVATENDENDGGDDEADEPPVVPSSDQEVVEPDAVISKRCKVFYLDAAKFEVRGTGSAHLKIINDQAVQLLVRAGTSLGTILLNTRINKDTKFSRGRRDKTESVDVMCLANPPFKKCDPNKMYQYVIKFKDAGVADEFFDKIQELVNK